MADLRAFVETKMFSKSEKNLEKVGLDTCSANGKRPLHHAVRLNLTKFLVFVLQQTALSFFGEIFQR